MTDFKNGYIENDKGPLRQAFYEWASSNVGVLFPVKRYTSDYCFISDGVFDASNETSYIKNKKQLALADFKRNSCSPLTKEEQKILDNAPDGATHFVTHANKASEGYSFFMNGEHKRVNNASADTPWFDVNYWEFHELSELRKKQKKQVWDVVNWAGETEEDMHKSLVYYSQGMAGFHVLSYVNG